MPTERVRGAVRQRSRTDIVFADEMDDDGDALPPATNPHPFDGVAVLHSACNDHD